MGIGVFENMAPHIPLYPVNHLLANQCYLIIHDATRTKQSHMSVLVDISGNSTEDSIFGILVHAVANLNDGLCPHGTSLSHEVWQCDREKLEIINLGDLADSAYLTGQRAVPDYLIGEYVSIRASCLG